MGFFKINTLNERNILPGVNVRFFHTDNLTFAHWIFEEGAEIPKHSHPHEQVTHIIDGTFELTIGNKTEKMGPGSAAIIEPDIPHHGKCISKSYILDVFHPVREDYKEPTN